MKYNKPMTIILNAVLYSKTKQSITFLGYFPSTLSTVCSLQITYSTIHYASKTGPVHYVFWQHLHFNPEDRHRVFL